LHSFLSAKSSFYLPAFEISRSCRTASGGNSISVRFELRKEMEYIAGILEQSMGARNRVEKRFLYRDGFLKLLRSPGFIPDITPVLNSDKYFPFHAFIKEQK
jgi:hypothetical protein